MATKKTSGARAAGPIDAYLAGLENDAARTTLTRLRAQLQQLLPTATETISYSMPAFRLPNGKVAAGFAFFGKNCGYYPHSGNIVPQLGALLAGYKLSPGGISFPPDTPLPKKVVTALVRARLAEIADQTPAPKAEPRPKAAQAAAPENSRAFASPEDLDKWLRAHHKKESELWVRIYKKGSGAPSVTWQDCVVACLRWGWIDGVKKPLDAASFLQRITPRRPKSGWSKKNREHAERLIAEGKMQPAGLVHVEAARADGRWGQAYAGSASMEIPADFLRALDKNKRAKAFFATLDRKNLFAIYYRLTSAKRPETRERRMVAILTQLAAGQRFH